MCPVMEGVSLLADVPLLEVSLCSTCPFMGGVPLWEVSLHVALIQGTLSAMQVRCHYVIFLLVATHSWTVA